LYAKQENMNLTLTLLERVTRVCEKWNTLFMIENGYSTRALFLDILLFLRMLRMLSLKHLILEEDGALQEAQACI